MKATFTEAKELSSDVKTFYFRPEKPVHFTAGQFTELTLPHDNPDERGTKRWFTISTAPGEVLLGITTRLATEKSSSFKQALAALAPGTVVDLAEPMGDFVLPKLPTTPLVFVAGGIGITPFHSIAAELAAANEHRDIRLIHAIRTEDDIIFRETFDAAGIHVTYYVQQPSDAWGGERGHITAEAILGLEQPNDETLIYLSGPEPMLEALENDLRAHDVQQRQIVTDFFPGYSSL